MFRFKKLVKSPKEYFYKQIKDIEYDDYGFITINLNKEDKCLCEPYKNIYYDLIKEILLFYKQNNSMYVFDKAVSMFFMLGLSNIDYVLVLNKEEMPVISMTKTRKMISNERIYIDSFVNDEELDTRFELITSYELLGCFTKITEDYINEFEEKDIFEIKIKDDKKIKCKDLLNKRVIFICEDLIEELSSNVLSIKDEEALFNYFNLNYENCYFKVMPEEIWDFFGNLELLKKYVFYHELGHAVFDLCDISDLELNEKQANYYASFSFKGLYDDIIEIFCNKIGKHYANPLLLKHSDNNDFKSNLRKLFGDE